MAFSSLPAKDVAFHQPRAIEIEKGESTSESSQQPAAWEQFPDAHRKKVLRKMDLRILPVLMTLYGKRNLTFL